MKKKECVNRIYKKDNRMKSIINLAFHLFFIHINFIAKQTLD